jgi:hypothetical protein
METFCKKYKEYWSVITENLLRVSLKLTFQERTSKMKSSFNQQAVLNSIIHVHKSETAKFHIQESNNRLPASVGCTMQPFIWNPGQNIDSNSGNAPRHKQNYPRYVIPQNCLSVHHDLEFIHPAIFFT